MVVEELSVPRQDPHLRLFDLTSLLPDIENLTVRASAPAYNNLRQRKPYFNLPIPDFQNTSILFFKYHTTYTYCLHPLHRCEK